jgi:hypothetical protein
MILILFIYLKELNFTHNICNNLLFKDKIIVGICAGMQILFNSSEEGKEEGLNLISGKVKKFNSNSDKQRWIFMLYESPAHSSDFSNLNNFYNLSSTYKIESDFPGFYESG